MKTTLIIVLDRKLMNMVFLWVIERENRERWLKQKRNIYVLLNSEGKVYFSCVTSNESSNDLSSRIDLHTIKK